MKRKSQQFTLFNSKPTRRDGPTTRAVQVPNLDPQQLIRHCCQLGSGSAAIQKAEGRWGLTKDTLQRMRSYDFSHRHDTPSPDARPDWIRATLDNIDKGTLTRGAWRNGSPLGRKRKFNNQDVEMGKVRFDVLGFFLGSKNETKIG